MDGSSYTRGGRGRGGIAREPGGTRGRPLSRNKHWSANDSRSSTPNHSDSERWERGGHRGGGRGRGAPRGSPRKFPNVSLRLNNSPKPEQQPVPHAEEHHDEEDPQVEEEEVNGDGHDEEMLEDDELDQPFQEIHEPELDNPEDREKFYQELVKAREIERKVAIAEGKMDDPLVPKRLEDAISIVGTCMDMCPRFERYRRERENNLFEWETIPGTKRVDHNRAVKMYERAAGDKTLPSDLRPPQVLKRTLDYLFHDLLPRGGFSATFNFIRDRSRAVRNDFTMQHITGPLAIECHDRCARFHILALHFERDRSGFSIPLEEQQLMNSEELVLSLQSLKEFYEDQRPRYSSPTELEMRVYHRLIHIRDQKERHEDIPESITSHPVFKLTTQFRLHVQQKSAPISKTSRLIVAEEGMQIFGQLVTVLSEQGNRVMVYLVACLLERLFGTDTIDDIEGIRGDLSISDIIDGATSHGEIRQEVQEVDDEDLEPDDELGVDDYLEGDNEEYENEEAYVAPQPTAPVPLKPSVTFNQTPPALPAPSSAFPNLPKPAPVAAGAFAGLVSSPNVFGTQSAFGTSVFPPVAATSSQSTFGTPSAPPAQSVFGLPVVASPPVATASITQPPSQLQPPSERPPSSLFNTAAPSAAPLNIFGPKPATPHAPAPLPMSSASSPSPFGLPTSSSSNNALSNTNAKVSAFSTPWTPPTSTSSTLNPKASVFTPPSKTSIFSQPLTTTINGFNDTTKFPVPEAKPPSMPIFTPPLPTTTPVVNGQTSSFGTTSTTSTTQTPSPSLFKKPSPPGSSSSTPPPTRPTAPPLLKINTNTSSGSSSSIPSATASPKVPPPLPKVQPISLPSTPNTVNQLPNPLLDHLRSALPSALSPAGSMEMLSPLVMGSPVSSSSKPFNNFSPFSTPSTSRIFKTSSPPTAAPPPTFSSPSKSNGKRKAVDSSMYNIEEVEEMKKKAQAFAQKSLLVKESFDRWVQRTTDRAAYAEASRHGDEYRQKLQQQNGRRPALQPPINGVNGDKKRRISSSAPIRPSPQKKRARTRVSAEYQPSRTDEELARRLKENRKDHELRWAQGSFLDVIRKHVKSLNPSTLKLPWHIWLSMNPESDATAIWLERKFDVPASGSWASESVFSIPISSIGGPSTSGYPGLIVFECSPLDDISDDLEKKYRILDDCSRFREIIGTLPAKRHFVPSVLIIYWGESEQTSKSSDLFDMVKKLVADSVLQSYQVLAMTSSTKDLDKKLDDALSLLALDTEGRLVQLTSLRGCFKMFDPTFDTFIGEWMENCNTNGRFNWRLFGEVIQVSITLLNVISLLIQSLMELPSMPNPLPDFDGRVLDDSDSTYDAVMDWLSPLASGSTTNDMKLLAMDLQSHRNISQEFPCRTFLEKLFQVTELGFERLHPQAAENPSPVLISNITSSLKEFKEAIQPHQMKLLVSYNASVRRSPKRRAYSVTTSDSPGSKRRRLSASVASTVNDEERSMPSSPPPIYSNGRETPSPTNSTMSLFSSETSAKAAPSVTVAMLRALTKDLKKKYGA
ncbi:hypothetical protein M413DRAFT_9323 [Hebeloma cylindrosporum]|uniref:SAC3/GANP/THP3 conserved domain-containing protein n=1 Tax=Hebeloma cylindrosporum TaxID=76867 RepID=A0A0C3CIS5_HEBCY|nr:hypothetical protein M413DRAFT_9323 [Hebeloma cylindrosporum h7]